MELIKTGCSEEEGMLAAYGGRCSNGGVDVFEFLEGNGQSPVVSKKK
jgi:hypothetical protein